MTAPPAAPALLFGQRRAGPGMRSPAQIAEQTRIEKTMPRTGVRPRAGTLSTRRATAADVPVLVSLVGELEPSGRMWRQLGVSVPMTTASDADEPRLAHALEDPGTFVLIAHVQDEPAGLLWLSTQLLSPLSGERVAQVHELVVARVYRHQGVGSALLQAAAAVAEECGAEALSVWTQPTDRESNRFFARLGFAPLAVRRVAPLPTLRRKLGRGAVLESPIRSAAALRRRRAS